MSSKPKGASTAAGSHSGEAESESTTSVSDRVSTNTIEQPSRQSHTNNNSENNINNNNNTAPTSITIDVNSSARGNNSRTKAVSMGSPNRSRAGSRATRFRAGTLDSKYSHYSDDTQSLNSKYSVNSQYHLVSRPTPIWVQARANDPPVQQPILAAPSGVHGMSWAHDTGRQHQQQQDQQQDSQRQSKQQKQEPLSPTSSLPEGELSQSHRQDGFPFEQPPHANGSKSQPESPLFPPSSHIRRIHTQSPLPSRQGIENDSPGHSRQASSSNGNNNVRHNIELYNRPSRWNPFLQATSRPETYDSAGYIDSTYLDEFNAALEEKWIGDKLHEATLQKLAHKKSHFSIFRGGSSHHKPSQSIHSMTRSEKDAHGGDLEPTSLSSARYFMSQESRKTWKPRLNKILLNNPMVPLTLRAIIFIFTCIALALACSIFVNSRHAFAKPITQQPSTIMAVVVQSVAIVYLVYITYDEYSSKPIGLREPKAKMRLIMLDLLFIIFSSANLALTFNTLYDVTWTCNSDALPDDASLDQFRTPYSSSICSKQRGLASFLFLVLVMWVATFTISIFRLVERVSGQSH